MNQCDLIVRTIITRSAMARPFFFFFLISAFIFRNSSTKGEQDAVGRTRTGSQSDPDKIDEWGKGWRDVVTGEDEKG